MKSFSLVHLRLLIVLLTSIPGAQSWTNYGISHQTSLTPNVKIQTSQERRTSSWHRLDSVQSLKTSRVQLRMVRTRGLEQQRDTATPTEGGMTLYVKAAEDGTSVGDCPFAHFVRLVLEEKGLDYDVKPCVQDTKPNWLVEFYEGKMPALRHRKECYTESGVIADYLEFFFPQPTLKPKSDGSILDGFFPSVAQYLKTKEGDDDEKLEQLKGKLVAVDEHLSARTYLDGDDFSLLDCRLIPQLYHLYTGIEGFKSGTPSLSEYPHLEKYYERCTLRPSFQSTIYPKETILWGWGNARK